MDVKAQVEVEKAVQILKLLGDKTRLSMMKLLQNNECCVCELVEIYKASQPAISQHLRKLRDIELVSERRKGHWIFYSLNKGNSYYQFVLDILDSLPSEDERLKELEKQGLRISCC
ncbi:MULTISPECIES: ArsR/SmtB family transcription factor [Priestia]|jgi:ArsR family transcriptional regulator, arsenate/arsenite/antimonite-responsive transcriptional repressor|uniref:Arsenical resistance operon repressor n=2 Tax=Priestia TaxID=2800373 RepID=D5DNR8_PRIM1|nr:MULTISPECIES: metalloregulator ArsR/SmtB family transcription factor [Priestia]AVX07808.1 ArsR family transcriptional regulator [Bacillus sp. Y-01]MBZ5483171.1 winged helix-turn-helix transcriptional regulator [Bacillus sp. T_4]MCJ7986725.1 metalloregulator ArsR/SmtB family transcription factor [Priestia sp. OVL9]MDH6655302.1 ArsR family transcriptional regulator [Bacillus sp. PvP124]MDP9574574.1 ArsR family transcriptional regulator [Bacillus sp. 1751]